MESERKELVHLWHADLLAGQFGDSPPESGSAPAATVSSGALVAAASDYGEAVADWVHRGVTGQKEERSTTSSAWLRFLDPGPCHGEQ